MEEVLRKHGYNVSHEELERKHRLLSEVIIFPDQTSRAFYMHFNTELLYLLGIVPDEKIVTELFEACTYLPWAGFPDIDALREINLPKGILSNWDITLPEKLKEHVNSHFSWILGSQLKGIRKPDPAFFKIMVESAGCEPGELVYVGDSVRLDIVPALQMGIRAILIDRPGIYPNSGLTRISNMKQLINLI
ncbi:HAD family hydrolase [Parasegetibacter sp. NRK P23]|nr:HAD family hydrolase [Parasegetibacter sp. NRK P23]